MFFFAHVPVLASAQSNSFISGIAEAAYGDDTVAGFYRDHGYDTLWTGPDDALRREALLTALDRAGLQGLPVAHYDAAGMVAAFRNVRTEGDRGRLEVAMTRAFLAYATDLSSGVIHPDQIDSSIVREIARPDPAELLTGIATADPWIFLTDLAPKAPEYTRLMKEKLRLEGVIASGGWGAVIRAGRLKPGDTGPAVVVLRDRLMAVGYLAYSVTGRYDRTMMRAVQRYQADLGINADGVAGDETIAALNTPAEERLKAVVVAMERLRWMEDTPRNGRYVWVNQPDFTAQVIDDGAVTFQTRAVIGRNVPDQRTPEFSDQMELMVANPSWGVPRSIIVKEYLPLLQKNPNAVAHLQIVDGKGRVISRGSVDFAAYSARSFPYSMRQPPSDGNALGKVKFMFPNSHNIYLHDTPAKNLFANEVRAYSHGCIRLNDPFDLAYTLLSRQSDDPKATFQTALDTDSETEIDLKVPVPVHLVYFTAWPSASGRMTYRNDIYGRDARIFEALQSAGVVLGDVQG